MDARTPPEPFADPASTADGRPQLDHSEIRTILIGVMLAMLLSALDQTIVATALPTIGLAFGDVANLPWIVTAYLLTATAVTPLTGKLADIYGPRPVLLAGIGLFLVGSVACALAPGMFWLVLARALQGIGGGGLISLAQTIVGVMIAPRERGRYQGYFAAVFISSSIAGPVLGGFFAEHLHWSLIFWINVPLGILAALMSERALRRLPPHHHKHRIDLLGALLMASATVALLLALSWGGARFAWLSMPVISLIGASVLLWSLFGVRVATAEEPLLPLSVLGNQVVRTGVVAAAFAMGTLIGLSIEIPLYLEGVMHLTASQSGLALIPLMAGVVVGATGTGRAMARVIHYKRIPIFGLSISIIALGVLTLVATGLHVGVLVVLLGVAGIGLGTVLPVSTVAIQNAVPLAQIGTATAAMNFFRSLGGAVLTAGFGALVIGMAGGQSGGLGERLLLHHGDDRMLATAFQWVFGAAALALVGALIAVLIMEERPLRTSVHATPVMD
ncbi:MFS transporter [Ancylobacter sp. 6x-1]|uniref:MFS transporter n=1 Tax=Ancylobacter crimeensis TaxID=2579147 RepID=A0ABT0DCX6_9HYPH|nr:MDR family MFS transporter [Ancylobacter crimeensis]MCK0197597.1 MFS transporter [Ancylobacter crimeensis]